MRRLLAILAILAISLIAEAATCSVESVTVDPSKPVRGDTITVMVRASPGEQVDVRIRFRRSLPVSGGAYFLELDGVEVPQRPNMFTVKATGVETLVVAVRLGIWISLSKDASGGVATMSQGDVPPGRYDVQVKGDVAPGTREVILEVTARTTVTVGPDGSYSISYDTSSIPAGTFTVDVGGLTRTLTLEESGGVSPVPSLVPPLAVFSPPPAVRAGEPAAFDGSASSDADGSIAEYVWDMGDGSVLRGVVVSHAYEEPGMYVVTLTVVDDVGLTGTRVELVSVGETPNRPPVPVASAERACFEGQLVGFSARSSYDPDGSLAAYHWDFGDGFGAEGASVSHRYVAAGVYNASLVVTDDEGLNSKALIRVRVLSPPVDAAVWVELTAEAGAAVGLPGGVGLVRLNSSGPVPLLFFRYPGNPQPDSVPPPGQVGGFIDLGIGDPDAVEWPIYVEVGYDAGSVPEGDEDRLGLYHHDGSGWTQFRDTGVRPGEGVVWAWVRRDELGGSPLTIGLRSLVEGAAIRGLILSSGEVGPGDEFTVSAEVLNLGEAEATFTLVLEVDGEAWALRTVSLGPGEARLVSFALSLDEPGVHRVGVGGVTVPLTVRTLSLPDLSVLGVIAPEATVGVPMTVSFSVSNVGEAPCRAFNVSLLVNDVRAGVVGLGLLAPGGSAGAEFTWTPDAPQSYRVRVVVDEWGGVREADEGNNEVVGDVEVSEAPVEATGWAVDSDTLVLLLGLGVAAVAGLLWLRGRRQSSLNKASKALSGEAS